MDIKKPDIDVKALLGKLAFLKNHLNMLVPLLIAVVGGVLFVPTHIINAGLRKDIQSESLQRVNKLKTLANEVVPERQWEVERQYQQAYAEDANAIEKWMKETSQRELLTYNLFPEPKTNSSLIFKEFGNEYLDRLHQTLQNLGAIRCPTQEQLATLVEGYRTVGGGRSPGEMYGRGRGAGQFVDATQQKVIDAVCRDQAKSGRIYLVPTALAGTSFWENYKREEGSFDDAVKECWYWQLGYWIISDVLDAVKTCNERASSVLTAPVKRLQSVQFSRPLALGAAGSMAGQGRGRGMYPGMRGMAGTETEDTESPNVAPKYVLSSADYLTPACTNRVSNEQYHIVHFAVQAVVSATEVMKFQNELCSVRDHTFLGIDGNGSEQHFQHNQITILEVHIDAVDRTDPRHQYYRYGDDAVVSVTLVCEYLFDKAGYEPWIPENVLSVFQKDTEE